MEKISGRQEAAANSEKHLGLFDLVALSSGTVIGAGVVSLIGISMLDTGASAWLAYIGAVVLGLIVISPYIFLYSSIRVKGGNYSFVSAILGDYWGGVYGMCFTCVGLAMGLFGVALSTYIQCLFPGSNVRLLAMFLVTAFYVLNLLGIKIMTRVEKAMFYMLVTGLLAYVITGFRNMTGETITVGAPDFFSGGAMGFLLAVTLLFFSTTGQSYVVAFSREAKNAKRDVPLAILITTGIILVLYFFVGFVTCNSLPVSEVAGKNLAIVAAGIMPRWMYYTFIIGGPIIALLTTINSTFVVFTRPMQVMVNDGFFPKWLGSKNRFGVPFVLLTCIYIIGMLPLVFNFSMGTIVDNTILIESISEILAIIAVLRYPKKIEGAWDNRYFKYSKNFFSFFVVLALIARLCLVGITFSNLTPAISYTTISLVAVFTLYSYFRIKTGRIHIVKSYELQ